MGRLHSNLSSMACFESLQCPAGPLADGLIEGGMPVARVRKIAQATAFLGPTACLSAAAICDDGPATVGKAPTHNAGGQSPR